MYRLLSLYLGDERIQVRSIELEVYDVENESFNVAKDTVVNAMTRGKERGEDLMSGTIV